jgi:hypothetical protein
MYRVLNVRVKAIKIKKSVLLFVFVRFAPMHHATYALHACRGACSMHIWHAHVAHLMHCACKITGCKYSQCNQNCSFCILHIIGKPPLSFAADMKFFCFLNCVFYYFCV